MISKKPKEYENWILELSGVESADWRDLEVTAAYGEGGNFQTLPSPGDRKILHFYVKVVGFQDDVATMRSWGVGPFKPTNSKIIDTLTSSLENLVDGKAK